MRFGWHRDWIHVGFCVAVTTIAVVGIAGASESGPFTLVSSLALCAAVCYFWKQFARNACKPITTEVQYSEELKQVLLNQGSSIEHAVAELKSIEQRIKTELAKAAPNDPEDVKMASQQQHPDNQSRQRHRSKKRAPQPSAV